MSASAGQHEGRPDAAGRADRAEQIGVVVALVGGWALMECRDKDEAVEWTKRFLGVAGHGEVMVRQVFGP